MSLKVVQSITKKNYRLHVVTISCRETVLQVQKVQEKLESKQTPAE